MVRQTPQIRDDVLTYQANHAVSIVAVGSADWFRTLDEDTITTFRFESCAGHFTARRERRKAGWFWYAYRKQDGKLHNLYLGKTSELTLERLKDVASRLAARIEDRGSLL